MGSEEKIIEAGVVGQAERNDDDGRPNYGPEESRRMLKNVIAISVAFMVLFTATGSMSNLQSSLNPEAGLGVYSRACGYGAMVLSSLFIPTFVIKRYSAKITLTVAMFGSIFSICAQFYPRFSTMIPASIISGLFSSPFWSAKCTYLTQVGQEYAQLVGQNSEVVITRFFGIFFLIFQSSKVWGNLIASLILSNKRTYKNGTVKDISVCGSNFCPDNAQDNGVIEKQPMYKVYTLAGVYLGVGFLAVVIAAIFVDSLQRYGEKKEKNHTTWRSTLLPLQATIRQMLVPTQIILIPLTMWSGLEQGFYSADFYQAFVTCAWGIENLGYVGICYGLCDAIAAYSFGTVVRHVGRIPVFLFGALLNIAIITTLFNWQPDPEYPWAFFVIAGIWGVADAIWQTQINAFYGILFPDNKEAGFSNYRLWESIGFILAFVNGDLLCVSTKMYILYGALTAGMTGYLTIEYLIRRKPSQVSVQH